MSRDEKTANERAPFCPICNHRHWARENHVFGKGTALAKPKPKGKRR